MRHHDHGHAFFGQCLHDIEDLPDHFRVQRRGRFIEQHYLGIHGQCPGDGDPLLLSAGQLVRIDRGLVKNADFSQKGFCPLLCGSLGAFSDHLLGERDVFKHRFVGKQVKGLEHHTDFGPYYVDICFGVEDIDPFDIDVAAGGGFKMIEAPEQGALSRTGRSDHHHDFSGFDFGGNVDQCTDFMWRIERFVDIANVNHDTRVLLSRY